MEQMQPLTLSVPFKLISVLLSGLFYYLGFSLHGNLGWLMWLAPIPVLYVSLYVKPAQAFGIAFLAYLLGRLSWLPYLISIMPLPLAILFTLFLPFIFALIIIATRKINLISQHWFSVFAFPVIITAYEYILFIFSKEGTMTSIAYTQSNYLPLIQIASITGILGISFLISFVPSSLALIKYYYKENKKAVYNLTVVLLFVVTGTFVFGWVRLKRPESGKPIRIGIITLDESLYKGVYQHDPSKEMQLAVQYLQETSQLSDSGFQIILLPEKALIVTDSTSPFILQKFIQLAASHRIQLIIGGAKQKKEFWLNNAWAISDQGKLLADYQKVNLFEGEILDGCKPGTQIGIFNNGTTIEGVAICKDMDFQQFILGYSKKSPAILYVPAWDFIKDGWLHSRMAILRSVEGGFSMARNARQGRLTISDWRGKVIAEANSESGTKTILTGKLLVKPHPTIYARAGDWFGTFSLFAAFGLFVFMFSRRKIKT